VPPSRSKVKEDEVPKVSPFTTIKHLSETRPYSYKDIQEAGLPYEAFLVNRSFSLTEDTVLAASLMNERSFLSPDIQATFYIHAIRPRRRFEKWPKCLVDADMTTIAGYYGMSVREAKSHAHLHTPEQLVAMQKLLDDGAKPSRFRE